MREITITSNDAGRRLDRFLRKYLRNASLGEIYKLIRKDVKVDGRRRPESYMLSEGEILTLYMADDVIDGFTGAADHAKNATGSGRSSGKTHRAKKQFIIIYEDENIMIVSKPYGLLTHGDRHEKKNHLANQVKDHLIETGAFDPRNEKVFSPAPANRLDRNTTGLVLFGKTSPALKALGEIIRNDLADKYYLTIACGIIDRELILSGSLTKDEQANRVTVSSVSAGQDDKLSARITEDGSESKDIITVVRPEKHLLFDGNLDATLTEIQLVTGRSHQIRAHLASIGHPVAGDAKYAYASDRTAIGSTGMEPAPDADIRKLNSYLSRNFRLSTQLLHAYRISFAAEGLPEELSYLSGRSFTAPVPGTFSGILADAGYSFPSVNDR